MMEKPTIASGYSEEQTERAEQVLLEVWSHLGDFQEYLVLVGGLVPRYLVPQNVEGTPRHCGTLDVDLAVSLVVADVKAYSSIRATLERMGLEPGVNARGNEQKHSFVMNDAGGPVVVDFLTTKYDGPPEVVRAIEGELSAIQVEGLGLALQDPVKVPIEGKALRGGLLKTTLRVCRPVPFVVLKALAFDKRREGKDVHDLVYILQRACGGPSRMAETVRKDERMADAFVHAVETLRTNFASPGHDGPIRCGRFLPDTPDAGIQAFAAVQEFLQAVEGT